MEEAGEDLLTFYRSFRRKNKTSLGLFGASFKNLNYRSNRSDEGASCPARNVRQRQSPKKESGPQYGQGKVIYDPNPPRAGHCAIRHSTYKASFAK